jgi:DNA-binding Xre family transcriptional regulator
MNLQEALNKTLTDNKIRGVKLAEAAGCTPGHISKIRSGSECTLAMLERILAGLEQIKPGAKAYFCGLWLGLEVSDSTVEPVSAEEAIKMLASSALTDEQIATLLNVASQKLRQPQAAQKSQLQSEQLPVAV